MSGPFSNSQTVGQPAWGAIVAADGNFTNINDSNPYDEVGYGEGGFGEDGYDTPSSGGGGIGQPNWSLYSDK